ncbi:hypothetical protein PVAP13_2NG073638 [Panicum virgatum]|uniref:Uncharacterized protein n=1 Tax=Panicum virgatum TaxID=38727 RepID=A0A8T0VD63_PANVG|nr:hypothetical protein PVAP13_2NG073638 [Panicum virgatum]
MSSVDPPSVAAMAPPRPASPDLRCDVPIIGDRLPLVDRRRSDCLSWVPRSPLLLLRSASRSARWGHLPLCRRLRHPPPPQRPLKATTATSPPCLPRLPPHWFRLGVLRTWCCFAVHASPRGGAPGACARWIMCRCC